MPPMPPVYDVLIVGAGFCGSVLGIKAADLGLKVKVLDSHDPYPNHFRAEKLETDQYEALEALGLIGLIEPKGSAMIEKVITFEGQKATTSPHRKHRGMDYSSSVNSLRSVLHERQIFDTRNIVALHDSRDGCKVQFGDGTILRTRLAVLATGMSANLRESLQLSGPRDDSLISTTFGFDVQPMSASGFPYCAFNFRSNRFVMGLHYITFFPIRDRMRVNLFTCWDPKSDEVRAFRGDPVGGLRRLFPDLESRIGSFHLPTRVQAVTTRYYQQECRHLKSVVIVGDAFQSVSPATGMGISKCLADAQVLLGLLPRLLKTSSGRLDLHEHYDNEGKRAVDQDALHRWTWANESATNRSFKTRAKKFKRKLAASSIRRILSKSL